MALSSTVQITCFNAESDTIGRSSLDPVLVGEVRHRSRDPPVLDEIVEEGMERRHGSRFAARLARRKQDAGDDRLAPPDLGLHGVDLLRQFGIGRQDRHAPPISEDDRECRERRAEFMRGPGGEKPHPHDMILFGRLLPEIGEMRVALAQVPVDPRDEDRQQGRIQHEADQHAGDVQAEETLAESGPELKRTVGQGQAGEAERRKGHHGPEGACIEQDGTERHLQDVEEDEGVCGAAREIELGAQGRHVEDQAREEGRSRDGGAACAPRPSSRG